jgi:hypothetical protein
VWVCVSFLEYGVLRCIWQYQLLTLVRCVLSRFLENRCLVDWLFREMGMVFVFMLSGVCLGLGILLVMWGVI